ncbi:MAG: penicillin-binding protein 2 [Lentisphaerae bacterium]|nr:penicillin-binding protein 2 [Lentisphaerota bacterium]
MPRRRPSKPEVNVLRLLLLWFIMMGLLGTLVYRLWNLQVAQGMEFQRRLVKQSLRSVRLPGSRGRILDARGEVLAGNRPSYCVSLHLEEFRRSGGTARTVDHVMDTLYRLAEAMDRPLELQPRDVRTHLGRRTPLPLVAWRDLDEEAVARFVEHAHQHPGTALTIESVREYPFGPLACHTLGYVGRAADDQSPQAGSEPEQFHYYLPEVAGRSGVEKRFDGVLRAADGGKIEVQVDVAGFKFDEVSRRDPGQGSDIELALDVRVQRAAEAALEGEKGAVVVMDPRNGDVLALASAPGFDPNDFVPVLASRLWNQLLGDERRPLYNRATAGEYAPGSTFKLVTLLAAMESGRVPPSTRYSCPGFLDLGRTRFRCWQHWGHGSLDAQHAIRYSCNVYLYHAALHCGAEAVQEMARACGFGQTTGVGLDFERPGLVPDNVWKRRERHDSWRDGDTCNLSIGQGALLVTPIQQAVYAAALANGGTLWRPRLVRRVVNANGQGKEIPPTRMPDGPRWSSANVRVVREGMRDAVNAPDGSGKRAAVPGVVVAAKTGTAEYGAKGSGLKLAWLVAFAPFDSPRYAVALVIEEAVSGGTTAAPQVRQLLARMFEELEGLELSRPEAVARPPATGAPGGGAA